MTTCKGYHEATETKYLTEFEQGVYFAKTGKLISSVKVQVGYCWGTKNVEECHCGGDENKCDFYEHIRRKKK